MKSIFFNFFNIKRDGVIFFIFLFTVTFSGIVRAQTETADYTFQYRHYLQAYSAFTLARDQYLRQKTLVSSNDATMQTKAYLIQRDQTLRTYLLALRYTLANTSGVSNSTKTRLTAELNDHITWLESNMENISGLQNPTLSDLFQYSDSFEQKKEEFSLFSYQTLTTVTIAKVNNLHEEFIAINTELKPYIEKSQTGYIKNWLSQTEDITAKVSESQNKMQVLADKLNTQTSDQTKVNTYTEVQNEANNAKQILSKGITYQKEIITELEKSLPNVPGTATESGNPATGSARPIPLQL